jgi:hypothetical protein
MALTKVSRGLLTTSIVDNGNATAITIDSSENVGIGTSSPSVNLEITESGSATNSVADVLKLNHITSGTAASGLGAGVVFSSERPSGGINLTRGAIYGISGSDPDDDGALAFYTRTNTSGSGFSEKLRIDSAGNLLVGTTSRVGSGKLSILYTSSVDAGIAIRSSVESYNTAIQFLNTAGTQVGTVNTSATSTTYNTSSDQRLKDNIADADDAGSKIDSIQVRKFDWIADGCHQEYGMVAQELQIVAPEAVHQPADSEEMMGVDYSKLVPMLVKEIQSLRTRVQELENN